MNGTPPIIDTNDSNWVLRLQEGDSILLVKEGRQAEVVEPYSSGRLFVREQGHVSGWYMSLDGKGFDGTQLVVPLAGNLSDKPSVERLNAVINEIRRTQKRLAELERNLLLWMKTGHVETTIINPKSPLGLN